MTTPTPDELDAVVKSLGKTSGDLNERAWNVSPPSAPRWLRRAGEPIESSRCGEDQEVRGWWDRMDAAIAALGGE